MMPFLLVKGLPPAALRGPDLKIWTNRIEVDLWFAALTKDLHLFIINFDAKLGVM